MGVEGEGGTTYQEYVDTRSYHRSFDCFDAFPTSSTRVAIVVRDSSPSNRRECVAGSPIPIEHV